MSGKTGTQCDHRFGRRKTGQEEEEEEEQHICTMLEKTHASHVKESSVDKEQALRNHCYTLVSVGWFC